MGIFDKFTSKPKPPKGYAAVNVTFTPEETEAISRNRQMYASIANADAPEGMKMIVPQKVVDGVSAQGLTGYVEDLMRELRNCDSDAEMAVIMDKAIKATMKAYAIHNLPVYLFQVAGMFELTGDAANATEFFRQFLRAQNEFKPDQVDVMFLNQTGFDIPKIVAMAKTKI
jgi:hypothetical protein